MTLNIFYFSKDKNIKITPCFDKTNFKFSAFHKMPTYFITGSLQNYVLHYLQIIIIDLSCDLDCV